MNKVNLYLTLDDVRDLMASIGEEMLRSTEELRDLDAAVGDGDLGVTVALGGRALKETATQLVYEDAGKLLVACGVKFNQAAASTFGVLFASALIEAGKALSGKTRLELADVVKAAEAAEAGIRKRGNAQLGDKTMLDAIVPAVNALRQAGSEGAPLDAALKAALVAARRGAEATEMMQSKIGRASWLGSKSLGKKDPGAVAVCRVLEAIVDYCQKGHDGTSAG